MFFSLQVRHEPSRDGAIALTADPSAFEGAGPVLLFLHGALQGLAGRQGAWAPMLASAADVVFANLPGQGQSPPVTPATLERFADNVADAAATALPGRPIVLLGESLGALVALAVAGLGRLDVQATIIVDPPFTTAKQWQLRAYFSQMLEQAPQDAALASLAWEMFGIAPERQEERIHYPLLDRAQGPVHLITGDLPLFPVRRLAEFSSLVDDTDRFVLDRFYPGRVAAHMVSGAGHRILETHLEAAGAVVRTILHETVGARTA